MPQTIIAANWKMNGTHDSIQQLITHIKQGFNPFPQHEIIIIPPFVYLDFCRQLLNNSPIKLGAQNVSQFGVGAYTGEIAAVMLSDNHCSYVLIGHSERRSVFNENNDIIKQKLMRAKEQGLKPILCVGENLEQRQQGLTEHVILSQLQAILDLTGTDAVLQDAVLAYEPVWAIGTGQTATPDQAQQIHALIRNTIAKADPLLAKEIPIIYGGSVKANNAQQLFAMPDINGFLVGGASLIAEEFLTICKVAE